MAWHAVVKEILIALPARWAPFAMAVLASEVGADTAITRLGIMSEIASFAYPFDSSVDLLLQKDSIACANASIPVEAVIFAGRENVN